MNIENLWPVHPTPAPLVGRSTLRWKVVAYPVALMAKAHSQNAIQFVPRETEAVIPKNGTSDDQRFFNVNTKGLAPWK
jgi:hypothetical protein